MVRQSIVWRTPWLSKVTRPGSTLLWYSGGGCASAGFAFVAAASAYLRRRQRDLGWAALCLFCAAIILMAALGAMRIAE